MMSLFTFVDNVIFGFMPIFFFSTVNLQTRQLVLIDNPSYVGM